MVPRCSRNSRNLSYTKADTNCRILEGSAIDVFSSLSSWPIRSSPEDLGNYMQLTKPAESWHREISSPSPIKCNHVTLIAAANGIPHTVLQGIGRHVHMPSWETISIFLAHRTAAAMGPVYPKAWQLSHCNSQQRIEILPVLRHNAPTSQGSLMNTVERQAGSLQAIWSSLSQNQNILH